MRPGLTRRLEVIALALIWAPFLLSAAVWITPPQQNGLTGFVVRAPVSWRSVLLLAVFLLALSALVVVAVELGTEAGGFASLEFVGLREFQQVTALLGLVGAGWVYVAVAGPDLNAIVQLIRAREFYRFNDEFQFGVGLATLRYASVIAGAIALANLLGRQRLRLLDYVSFTALVATALTGSRLCILMAAWSAVLALTVGQVIGRFSVARAVVLLGLASVLIIAASYLRNANFYATRGVASPVEVTAVNAQAYLATPTQVTMLMLEATVDHRAVPPSKGLGFLGPLLPPYVEDRLFPAGLAVDPSGIDVEARYQGYVDLSTDYTTNGVLVDTLMRYGWLALPMIIVVTATAVFIGTRFVMSGPVGAIVGGAIMYGLAETWRVGIYDTGILHFIGLVGFLAACVGALRRRRSATSERLVAPSWS